MSPAEDPMPTTEEGKHLTVLVVEDEVLLRLALAETLRASGMRVIEAASGEEARDLLLAGVDVNIVFSDINMPGGMDGAALASWVMAAGAPAHVVLTSGERHMLEAARDACPEVKAFIDKPYDHQAIAALLRGLAAPRDV